MSRAGLGFAQQQSVEVFYDRSPVGAYLADLIVEGQVILELKAAKCFEEVHVAQCMNHLKASRLSVCLLINFGTPRVQIKRDVSNF